MHSRRTVLFGAVGASVGSLAGCTDVLEDDPPVEAVELSIADVRAPDLGLTSATVPAVIEVTNTADSDSVPSPTVDYNAFIGAAEVVSARESVPDLPAGESTRRTFELIVDYGEVGSGVVELIESGEFTVRLEGSVTADGASASFEETYQR